jgi:hypothetical protein
MGKLFSKPAAPQIVAAAPDQSVLDAQARAKAASDAAAADALAQQQKAAADAENERKAFINRLRGARALLSSAGERGYDLPTTLGG